MATCKAIVADLRVVECPFTLHFPGWTPLPPEAAYPLRGLLGESLRLLLHPDLPAGAQIPADSPFWPLFKPHQVAPKIQRPCFLVDSASGGGAALALHGRLRLFGSGAEYLGLLLDALAQAGPKAGFGPARTPFEVEVGAAVERMTPWQGDGAKGNGPERLALEFVTPAQLSLKLDPPLGKTALADMLTMEAVPFRGAWRFPLELIPYAAANSAARTLQELAETYGSGAQCDGGWATGALEQTRVTRCVLERRDDEHFSDRKKAGVGGIVGRLELETPAEVAQMLRCGEVTAIGARAIFGNGRIRVTAL